MKKNYFFRLALLLFAVTLGQSVKAQDEPIPSDEPEWTLEGYLAEELGTLGNDGKTFKVDSAEDWYLIAGLVAEGYDCAGLTFILTEDIPSAEDIEKGIDAIVEPIGCQLEAGNADSRRRFAGKFDGRGRSITVNLTSAETNPNYTAPFAFCKGVTIEGLTVKGKITTTGTFAGGLVGSSGTNATDGVITIDRVVVDVEMECNYLSGNQGSGKYANQAGFVGIAEGKATITKSKFCGKLTGADFAYSAGFIALNKGKGTTLQNCFFVPSEVNAGNVYGSSEFAHDANGGNHTLNNCFYTVSFSDDPNLAQGVKVLTELPTDGWGEGDYLVVDGLDLYEVYYIILNNPDWRAIQETIDNSETPGAVVTLEKDVTAGTNDAGIVVPSGKAVILNMNGHTLDRALDHGTAKANGYVIKVEEGSALNITDGTIRGGNNNGNGGGICNLGELHLAKVTITGNYASKGAGIYSAYSGSTGITGNPMLTVDNDVQINGNSNDNVYLTQDNYFTIYKLPATASIGVTAAGGAGTVIAVRGEQAEYTVINFFSDNANLFVDENADGLFLSDAEAVELTLYDSENNEAAIAKYNGKKTDVTLQGRSFKSGVWNTLCLPFDVTFKQLKNVMGNGVMASVLDNATLDSEGTLTLGFAPLIADNATVKAGTPFLVKGTSKKNPVFADVTIKDVHNDVIGSGINFVGTYSRVDFTAGDTSILFMSSNKLYYPGEGNYVNAMRAYFKIPGAGEVKVVNMDFGEDDATAIMTIDNGQLTTEGAIYNLAGQRLQKMQKGINIVNGKKILF